MKCLENHDILIYCWYDKQCCCCLLYNWWTGVFALEVELNYWQQKPIINHLQCFHTGTSFQAFCICNLNFCRGTNWLLNWQNFRRLYLYAMTEAVKGIILKHRHILLSEESKTNFSLNERDVISAATLPDLDDAYTR